ncbi:PAS domain-containing protein [Natroniella acetigena]|uniref:PAS domain-containing protein n=1 Tax=Natroniella acetigena TaxID=52004 RepID=UPI00200B960F|nr:PAS domain-containing protein [Natroniella acetigena]MCK8827856.1 PAS domain-containing protein [Natroniella acetigena]
MGFIVDRYGRIMTFNPAAEEITGLSTHQVMGEDITDVIPNSRLKEIIQAATPEIGRCQEINQATIITNRSPIIIEGQVVGGIAVF